MAFTKQFNTNALLTLLNQSVAGGGPITITSVQVGSGFPAVSDNPENYTGLKVLVQTLGAVTSPSTLSGITSINADVLYQSTIRFQVSSQDAPLTYQWNEYGVFAKVGTGTPVLICYVTTGAATGDTITPSGTGIPVVKQNATVINYSLNATTTTALTLVNTVDLHSATHLDNGVDPIPIASTTRTGSLPISAGTGYQVLIDAAPNPLWSSEFISRPTPLFINGDMKVNQRYNNTNNVFAAVANGAYTVDCWKLVSSAACSGLASVSMLPWDDLLVPDGPWYFRPTNFLRVAATTAKTSLAAGDFYDLCTFLEGYDVPYGQQVTISLLARSLTSPGTYAVIISNGLNPIATGAEFYAHSIAVTTSWRRFMFTLPKTWPATSAFNLGTVNLGLQVAIRLVIPANSLPAQDVWSNGSAATNPAANLLAAVNNTFDFADLRGSTGLSSIGGPVRERYPETFYRASRYLQVGGPVVFIPVVLAYDCQGTIPLVCPFRVPINSLNFIEPYANNPEGTFPAFAVGPSCRTADRGYIAAYLSTEGSNATAAPYIYCNTGNFTPGNAPIFWYRASAEF